MFLDTAEDESAKETPTRDSITAPLSTRNIVIHWPIILMCVCLFFPIYFGCEAVWFEWIAVIRFFLHVLLLSFSHYTNTRQDKTHQKVHMRYLK